MKKYLVSEITEVEVEHTIIADSEEEAREKFYEWEVYDSQIIEYIGWDTKINNIELVE